MSPGSQHLSPKITDALPGDIPGIMATESVSHSTQFGEDDFESAIHDKRMCLWVAKCPENTMLGHGLFQIVADEMEILTFAVNPVARRQGVGAAILAHALSHGRSIGITRAFLEVRENNTAAKALYGNYGFEASGRRERYYRDGTAAVLMSLAVD